MNITYRGGRKEDCSKLAEFVYLYKRCGFEIVSRIEMAAHELIPHEGGAFLMSCRLE